MALINVDTTDSEQVEQLKKEYKILQVTTVTYLSLGFIALLSSPFVINAKDNPVLRYLSLFSSLFCGSTAMITLKRLEEIEPQYTVIKKAETRTFINKSATSEFTLMKLFEREAGAILRPVQVLPQSQPTDAANTAAAPPENLRHDHIEGAAQNSALAASESGEAVAAPEEGELDTRTQRLQLLAQLKKNKKGKNEMLRRLFGVEPNHSQYDYYLQMLEQMLEELKQQGDNN